MTTINKLQQHYHYYGAVILATGKYRCGKVRVYPAECGEQLGKEIPKKKGAPNPLFLKSFSEERTLWDSSLPVILTLWDTSVLRAPALLLSQSLL